MRWNEMMPLHSGEISAGNWDPFPVRTVLNARPEPSHILSVSLFDASGEAGFDLLRPRFVDPILEGAAQLRQIYPGLAVRVYLAADLAHLAEVLIEDCEVYLMEEVSSCSSPGMIWRHLAFEDSRCPVTVMDAEEVPNAANRLAFTEALKPTACPFWRIPVSIDFHRGRIFYKAIAGTCFGGVLPIPIRGLFRSFWDEYQNGRISKFAVHPADGKRYPIFGAEWPSYGFDEFFLNTTVYPYFCEKGCVAVSSFPKRSYFFAADIEFAALCNPNCCLDFKHFRDISSIGIESLNSRGDEGGAPI